MRDTEPANSRERPGVSPSVSDTHTAMAFARTVILFFIAFTAISASAAADSIHGCGGFVEASPSLIRSRKSSDTKLDYSHITVDLQTVDGLVKDRTQCAPNGYYFIPVYDKGTFVVKIKGPEGWSWNPDNVPVVVDQNGCNANSDINFQFTGFTVSGRVLGAVGGGSCSSKDGGPSNVKVELLSVNDNLVSSVFTYSSGVYSFTNIIPGKYKLRASHPALNVEVRGSPEVELGFGNAIVDDIFFVPGYDIYGFVVAQGNPILGVHMYLYSDDVLEVACPQGSGDSPRQRDALCHAVSDADGKFTFNSIPCGTYELWPYYKGENTIFDVSPPSMIISVEHHHVTIAQKFQVTGFSVGGRVVDSNGVGVEGVKIIIDGHIRSVTDWQGYYKLDQVTSKHYTILAEKNHYKFNSLQNFLVLPNMASVPDINAAYYDICGVVRSISADYKAKVALTHGPENVKPQVKRTDEKGRFCFEVPAGEYRLATLAAKTDGASGLLYLPSYLDLRVSGPLLDIQFSQALVDIQGSVNCKETCGPSVAVSLISPGSGSKKEIKTVMLSDASNSFLFQKVLPGKYRLEVKHESSPGISEEDNWCWEQSAIDVDVGIEGKTGIAFVQKGYWINIISTHDVDAYLKQPDHSIAHLPIKKGLQRICVENPGLHELEFANSCIFFGSSSVNFDALSTSPVHLTGRKYLLRGEILVELITHDDVPPSIVVDILNKEKAAVGMIEARLTSIREGETNVAIYEYSTWSNLGDELTFFPRDSRDNEEKKFLFYPRESSVSVTTDGCQAATPPFIGRLGLYMEGSVSPALSEVNIRIIAGGANSNALLQKGEVALETKTGADGLFIGGPLYDDTSYTVEASKPGYFLKQVGPKSFSCQKLGQISVHIYSAEESKDLFPSVLLSLSGDDGYRNNTVTGPGGNFLFDNLFPGSFYLRPLLKEYSFSPAAQAIELGSGESKEVIFHATRVAYSAIGLVTLLSGQPKEGVVVEARSESKGYYEETTTDSLGKYRLRGLLPYTTYAVKVVAKEELGSVRIERASPELVAVEVLSEDIQGLDFVVFEQPDITILSGHVEGVGLDELQPHLSIEIKSSSDPTKIESAFPLPLSYFFEVRDLPKGKHLVQLKSAFPSSIHKFESGVMEVDLEEQPQLHVGPLRFKVEEHHYKQELTPAPVFPLIVGVSVIVLFISMPRLKDLYQLTVGMTAPLGSSPTSLNFKKEIRKPVVRKRTY